MGGSGAYQRGGAESIPTVAGGNTPGSGGRREEKLGLHLRGERLRGGSARACGERQDQLEQLGEQLGESERRSRPAGAKRLRGQSWCLRPSLRTSMKREEESG